MQLPTAPQWQSTKVVWWLVRYFPDVLPLVLSGLHRGLVPIHVELIRLTRPGTPLPMALAMLQTGLRQVGACGLHMKTQSPEKTYQRGVAGRAAGYWRTAHFGVTLPLGKPFIGACLGGAVGGALISYWKVLATVITFEFQVYRWH